MALDSAPMNKPRKCSDCGAPILTAYRTSYCRDHENARNRARVKAKPMPRMDVPLNDRVKIVIRLMRLAANNPETKCLEWMGARSADGYGRTGYKGRSIDAHRLAYAAYFGPFDHSLHIRHKCDNPRCIEPRHLSLGTHADNMRDRSERLRLPQGSANSKSKLCEDDIPAIRRLLREGGLTLKQIGEKYGVTYHAIWTIKHNKSWRHVP
jgi:hypothetical protein